MLKKQNIAILLSLLSVFSFVLLDYSKEVFADNPDYPLSYPLLENLEESELEILKPTSKFYLTFESGIDWQNVNLTLTLEDNSVINLEHIHPDESVFGENSVDELLTSQLLTFDQKVVKVVARANVSAQIHSIENQTDFDTLVSPSDFQPESIRKSMYQALGLNILTREEWGAPTTSLWYPQISPNINQIVIHHTATNPNTTDPAQAIRDIYEFHKNRCSDNSGSYDPNTPNCDEPEELWQDIGYNFLIDQNGTIYEGRAGGFGVTAAHAPPNYATIGISLIGNFEATNPTDAQKQSLKSLVANLADLYELDVNWGTNLIGHRDKNITLCPGTNFYNQLAGISNEINSLQKSNANLNNVMNYVQQLNLSSLENLTMAGDLAQVSIKTNSISSSSLDYIRNNIDYVDSSNSTNFGGKSVVLVDPAYLKTLIREIKLLSFDIKIQPIFTYKTTSWDNSDSLRSIPSDYDTNVSWNLEMINMPEAWKSLGGCSSDNTCGGDPSVVIAVIDTGVAHEEYDYDAGGTYSLVDVGGFNIEVPASSTPNGVFNEGYDRRYSLSPELNNVNFVDAYDTYQDYICSIRSSTAYPCNSTEIEKINHANDDNGHGTFVTTIIAGDTSDTGSNNLVGIAHNTSIMPIKPFYPNDTSFCFFSNGNNDPNCTNPDYDYRSVTNSLLITQAVLYAVDNGADVINLSLSGSGFDPDLQDAINYAADNNVVVVAASGNNGSDVANYFPGGMDNVISVGAVNPDGSRSYYSNYGAKLDLVAPVGEAGTDMIASRTFDCYVTDTCSDESGGNLFYGDSNFTSESTPLVGAGTSFAAPQVSAVVGLMKWKKENATPFEVEQILRNTAIDINSIGFDVNTGSGVVNPSASIYLLWDDPQSIGLGASEVVMQEYDSMLFQSVLGTNNGIYTRYFNGSVWSNWEKSGIGKSSIEMYVYGSSLYQTVLGTNNGIYTRSYNGSVWTNWSYSGLGSTKITMIEFDGKLFQSVLGTNNGVYTRYYDGVNWSNWSNSGLASKSIVMEVYDGILFQAVLGTDSYAYTRSFDGVNWSIWSKSGIGISEIKMKSYNSMLFQTLLGTDNRIYTRNYDGVNWSTWSKSGYAKSAISMEVYSNRLYQSVIGSNDSTYVRFIYEGSWTNWLEINKQQRFVYLKSFDGKLHLSTTSHNDALNYRISIL